MGTSTTQTQTPTTTQNVALGTQGNNSSSVGGISAFSGGNTTIYSQSPEALALAGSVASQALQEEAANAQGVLQVGEAMQASAASLYAKSNFSGQIMQIGLPILGVVVVLAVIWYLIKRKKA